MKRMAKMATATVVLIIAVTTAAWAWAITPVDENAEKTTLVGIVTDVGPGLTVKSDDGTYTVQMGNPAWSRGLGFEPVSGEEIVVYGFVSDDSIVPIVIVYGGDGYFLRDTDGAPLWPRSPANR
jgi:hypothetical protein